MIFFVFCVVSFVVIISDDFLVNENFNGLIEIEFLLGLDVLEVGDKGVILLMINVGVCGINNGLFFNMVVVDVVQGDGIYILDNLIFGVDFDLNGDNILDEEGGIVVSFDEVVNFGVVKDLIFV